MIPTTPRPLGRFSTSTSTSTSTRAGRVARALRRCVHGCIALALLAGCSGEGVIEPLLDTDTDTETPSARSAGVTVDVVDDLLVTDATDSSTTISWTEVDDGTGQPASYQVRFAPEPIEWSTASPTCDGVVAGGEVGGRVSCTVAGLAAGSRYDFQLVSYSVSDPATMAPSNVAHGSTSEPPASEPPVSEPPVAEPPVEESPRPGGIWIDAEELASLPTSGPAWEHLVDAASRGCASVELADQDQTNNVCILAKALVHARLGVGAYRSDVVNAIRQIVDGLPYSGRALALGRELGAYAIAADLIDLSGHDPALDEAFRSTLRTLLTSYTESGPSSLVECHERRPNNWGTMCGGARAAIAAYLGDEAELARVAQVFRGWLGDRSSYAGFEYGDLSWQCDPKRPVGINPTGCRRDGHDLDGVIPDDQRRGGSYSWPAPRESYVWESLQGAVMQAVILERAGYAAFEWEDQALRRAAEWLHERVSYPAEGDDTWQPHVFNHYYGTTFAAPSPSDPGKNVGWTDWTHGR